MKLGTRSLLKGYGKSVHYILTQPKSAADVWDDLFDGSDNEWREKSHLLQLRRWRRIKNTVA